MADLAPEIIAAGFPNHSLLDTYNTMNRCTPQVFVTVVFWPYRILFGGLRQQ
jgi:hypothetical protein